MTKYVEELIAIIRGNLSREELIDRLFDYHDNDIAEALELLTPEERKRLYSALAQSGWRRFSPIWTTAIFI